MKQPFYYFDQLFEKLPNGQYREREKPAPLDPDRHLYSKDSKTGKFIVLWFIPWRFEYTVRNPDFKIDPIDWFSEARPLLGGRWDDMTTCHSFGPRRWDGNTFAVGAVVSWGYDLARATTQQDSLGGTSGGITKSLIP